MIDFSEELKKFRPILEVEGIENDIDSDEIKDFMDILQLVACKED